MPDYYAKVRNDISKTVYITHNMLTEKLCK